MKVKKRFWYDKEGYYLEVGKDYKGEYKFLNYFDLNHSGQAQLYYQSINIGKGYKKRLVKFVNGEGEVMYSERS